MVRIKSNVVKKRGRKRVLRQAKGQYGHRSKHYTQARRSLMKGMSYAYRDRKVKKREFRRLWIIRINAACRESGISYSRFIRGLTASGVEINRKMLAELAVSSPLAFKRLVKVAKENGSKNTTGKITKTTSKSKG